MVLWLKFTHLEKMINKSKQGKKNRAKVRDAQGKFVKGHPTSKKIKKKISNTLKKKIKNGEFIIPWKGKKMSEERRKQLGTFNKGKKRTLEFKQKVSKGLKKAYAEGLRKGVWMHDTRPERELREIINEIGIDFEEQKNLFGTPDFFIEPNICIFADGVYWHNYPNGTERDKEVNKILESQKYKILRFWETDIYSDKIKIKEEIENSIRKAN